MPTNADYTREYLDIVNELDGDIVGRRAALSYMESSTAIVHHEVVACSFLPRLFNAETYRIFKDTAETAHRILVKVMQRYLDDPEYRKIFSFDPRLEELILLPRGYESLLPFARVDVFFNEDTGRIGFCEFNADGSSGMNENREITHSIEHSESYKRFAQHHQVESCELFESWVVEFLSIYATYQHRVENPHIAICDFLENAVVDEFKVFAQLFAEHGISCSIYDVRELTFDGVTLKGSDGKRVDAIWRRSVTNDIIDHWDESQQLIEAVRAEKVALIGSFAGHLVHDKQIFQVLFDEKTVEFLDAEEINFIEQTIPLTTFLDDDHVNLPQIRENKDEWIIKPTDNYGAADVYAGTAFSEEDWNALIDRFANAASGAPFIVQRYITPFKTPIMPADTNLATLSDDQISRNTVPY
ncbi:MAG: carboxylate--amine ligase, partial [Raoultibacter sp.]